VASQARTFRRGPGNRGPGQSSFLARREARQERRRTKYHSGTLMPRRPLAGICWASYLCPVMRLACVDCLAKGCLSRNCRRNLAVHLDATRVWRVYHARLEPAEPAEPAGPAEPAEPWLRGCVPVVPAVCAVASAGLGGGFALVQVGSSGFEGDRSSFSSRAGEGRRQEPTSPTSPPATSELLSQAGEAGMLARERRDQWAQPSAWGGPLRSNC